MRRKSFAFCWLITCLVAGACAEAHPVAGTRPGHEGDGSVDAGEGDGGGDGDGDGDGDLPDAGPPPPSCDPSECQGASSMLGETPGCCTEDDYCGIDTTGLGLAACIERDAPGMADATCSDASIFGLVNLPGCCARGGKCGHLIRMLLPLGCLPSDVDVPIPGLEATTPASCVFASPE